MNMMENRDKIVEVYLYELDILRKFCFFWQILLENIELGGNRAGREYMGST